MQHVVLSTDRVECHTMMSKLWSLLFVLILMTPPVSGGLLAYGLCQAGCAAVVVACYSNAGFVFGTVTAGAGTPPAICNATIGKCRAACAEVTLLAPIP